MVLRRPVQEDLFRPDSPSVRSTVIASNREEPAQATGRWVNQRGETSEKRIKELKRGLGMERRPCGTVAANSVFFRMGLFVDNRFVGFTLVALPSA